MQAGALASFLRLMYIEGTSYARYIQDDLRRLLQLHLADVKAVYASNPTVQASVPRPEPTPPKAPGIAAPEAAHQQEQQQQVASMQE